MPDALREKDKVEELRTKLKTLPPEEVAARLHSACRRSRTSSTPWPGPAATHARTCRRPIFKKGVLKLEDLQPGMELKGTVLNVVDFGAFVDIGLKDSGLVHISQMANRYVKSPYDVVAVGDVVTVWVLSVDKDRRRVSLTMIQPGTERKPPERRPQGPPRREGAPSGHRREGAPAGHGAGQRRGRPGRSGRSAAERRPCRTAPAPRRRWWAGTAARGWRPRRSTPRRRWRRRSGTGRRPAHGPALAAARSNRHRHEPARQSAAPGPAAARRRGNPGRSGTRRPGRRRRRQGTGAQAKRKSSAKPNLSQAALAGATPLSTFGELAAFWEAKKKEGETAPVPTPPAPEEGQPPPA